MTTTHELSERELVDMAWHVVRMAEEAGFVVTIERRPLLPLAMGHHEPVVEVRQLRQREARVSA
jgi:hypothetical protein